MCVYRYACRQATVVLREGTFVAGLVRLYVHGLLGRRETNAVGRSVGRSVLEGCNRAGDGETKGVGYLQARAVLYSSSDGRIVSMRATVGVVDSTSQQFTGIE